MPTVAETLSIYTNQSQVSNYFLDKVGIASVSSYSNGSDLTTGTTETSTAIQSTIDAVNTLGGGLVWLPFGTSGIYKISSPITSYSNISIIAAPGVMIHDYNTSDYCFKVIGGSTFATDAKKNLKIAGMKFKNMATSSGAIKMKNVWVAKIEDIFIENGDYATNVIYIEDFFNVKLDTVYMNSNEGATALYVNANTGNSGQLIVENCLIQRNAIGIHLEGTAQILDGVKIDSCGIGANTTSGVKIGKNLVNVSFPNSHIENHDGVSGRSDTAIDMVIPSGNSEGIDFSKLYLVNNKYSIKSDRTKRVTLNPALIDAKSISGSVGVTMGANDQRWFFGTNLFQNVDTEIIEAGSLHIDMTNFVMNNNGTIVLGRDNVEIHYGTGTPEGSVTAPVGSIYFREDPSNSNGIYQKMSGTGNTGWITLSQQNTIFSDATRPLASTLTAGTQIWNTSDNAPNWSDGTNWRDAAGSVT